MGGCLGLWFHLGVLHLHRCLPPPQGLLLRAAMQKHRMVVTVSCHVVSRIMYYERVHLYFYYVVISQSSKCLSVSEQLLHNTHMALLWQNMHVM